MLRRSSRINNRKILKSEGGDDDVATSSCDSFEALVLPDCGDESSNGATSAKPSPLQNVVILRHFFEICPTQVLAICRLVCKQWYEESLLTWRNSTPLTFTLENGHLDMKYVRQDGTPDTVPLQNFLEYAADPKNQYQEKPYRHFRIKNSIVDSDIETKTQFDIFWTALGSNLTTLELIRCKFLDDEEFRRIIFSHCPKLKRLVIDMCYFFTTRKNNFEDMDLLDYKEQPLEQNKQLRVLKIVGHTKKERNLPVSWLELLSHFPLISSLTDDNGSLMIAEDFDSLTKAIRMIRERDEQLLPIKVFNIGGIRIPAKSAFPPTKQTLTIFQELRLPLQTLWIKLESDVEYDLFIDNFAHTRHLLNDVLNLFIEGNFLIFSKLLAFLNRMSNIESLNIFDEEMRNPLRMAVSNVDTAEPVNFKKMLKLKELALQCKIRNGHITDFQNWMPNVTNLRIYLNDKQFGMVCKTWKALKQFVVWGDALTDEGVTGQSGVTILQNLEEFIFESNKLTAKSVFNGFLKLPNLRLLKPIGTKPVLWGARTKRAILDRNIRMED